MASCSLYAVHWLVAMRNVVMDEEPALLDFLFLDLKYLASRE
jgi:hypothetical protein